MTVVREFREALRRLLKRPGYALLSVCVLGAGLGVLLFVFGMVNTTILQPFPFPQASRLMAVGEPLTDGNGQLNWIRQIDSDQYLQLRDSFHAVDAMAAWNIGSVNLDTGTGAVRYFGGTVSASLLSMVGAEPLLGRSFVVADDKSGEPRVVLLSASLWRNAFHGNPHVIGQSVQVNGKFATVVGVLRKGAKFPPDVQLWLPIRIEPGQHRMVYAVARLAPGVGLGQAQAELAARAPQLQRVLPPDMRAKPLIIGPLANSFTAHDLRHSVWLMFGAAVLVMLLAGINVANLQLAQTLKRRHELALRSALGSSRTRLLMGSIIESLLLSAAALVPAFAITWCGNRWLDNAYLTFHPLDVPYPHGIDGWVIGFGIFAALVSTGLAGGISAWRASRANLGGALRDGSKGSSGGFARVAKMLVVAEVALTVVLLVGAGMFVGALNDLLGQPNVGAAHAAQVLTADVSFPPDTYQHGSQRIRFFHDVVEQLQRTSSVVSASASNTIPSAVLGSHEDVSLPGHAEPPEGWPQVQMGIVDPHFLDTYGVRLLQGRFFGDNDRATSEPVAVIDAKMAAAMWPHEGALGRKLVLWPGRPQARTLTVVGVVQTLQMDSGLERALPGMMLPLAQAGGQSPLQSVELAVRVHGNSAAFAPHVVAAVHAVDPQVAVYGVHTQAWQVASSRTGIVILTDVFGALGLVALLLAAAGLYGVLAFSVAQRTRELGIRRAIGASNVALAYTVGRTLALQLGLGLCIGVALAVPWSGLLAGIGLGTHAHDPWVFAPVLLMVIGVSVLAGLMPLIRALRVDPAEALRYE